VSVGEARLGGADQQIASEGDLEAARDAKPLMAPMMGWAQRAMPG